MTTNTKRLLLYAPNIHTGGGAILLKYLLEELPVEINLVAWLDARYKSNLNLPYNTIVKWVEPSVTSRLCAELTLKKESSLGDCILCMHGLPPLLKLNGNVIIFQQNRNYFGLVPLNNFVLRTRIRLKIEQLTAYFLRHRVKNYWVQTPSMAIELKKWYGISPLKITVRPFYKTVISTARANNFKWDFIYVADGEGHKNHKRLIEAWVMLAKKDLYPSLALTLIDRYEDLKKWINEEIFKHGLNIQNLGYIPHDKLMNILGESKAMVFPSISESFGLPLIEAQHYGLPIVASELDFVRDVCDPVQSFDPYSTVSIARSIIRFMGVSESKLQIISAKEFLHELLDVDQI